MLSKLHQPRRLFLMFSRFGLALLLTVAIPVLSSTAAGQTLPAGLRQTGGVIMMSPIADTGSSAERGPWISPEQRPSAIKVLSASDHLLYQHAFDAADRGDWIAAKGLADQGHDPIARRIVQWRYLLDKNSGASFGEIAAFLKTNPDWPARDTLYARAERAMAPTMDARAVIEWFGSRPPVTGLGMIRLGDALIATGSVTRGRDLVARGWIEGDFEPADELLIVQRHGDILTPDIDRQRLSRLLWSNDLSAARREMSRVTSDAQQVAQARLALQSSSSSGLRLAGSLPSTLRADPGLIFDQARTLRRQGSFDAVAPLLERAPVKQLASINPGRWWSELNLASRQAIQDSNYHSAYWLASNNGLSTGTEYSEAEFMAGWIALRFLHDPQDAMGHFKNLQNNVTRPISLARALYWQGRTSEAAGDLAAAWSEYKAASNYSETFYGQLALAKIDSTPHLHLNAASVDASSAKAAFDGDDVVRAIRILADIGMESLVRTFAMADTDSHNDPKRAKLMAEMLVQSGFPEVAVRVAKAISYTGTLLAEYSHPVIAIPRYTGPAPAPEPALVLGIIRQETEFDPTAVSAPGARGLMQLMPASARQSAAYLGLPYRPNDLLTDTSYNVQLGMGELSEKLSDWGGSYVLAAAAYNAGPTNVKRWIATYGDPRSPTVDPIDWIELIPFNETRNYVQRVLENTQVYRNRLSGHDEPLRIVSDLYRPASPNMKVLPYSPSAGAPRADGGSAASATGKSAADSSASVAPKPRPAL